jgi:hypothetical protein
MMENHGDFNAREDPNGNGNNCWDSNGAATVRATTENFR